jgi:hypothetical protein
MLAATRTNSRSALANMSMAIALTAPMRSSNAPASGLIARPGANEANATQPTTVGAWKRSSA